jgi:hypothetical protein
MKNGSIEKELIDLEKQYWQAIKDSCIVAGAQGVTELDRKSLGAMTRASSYELKDYQLGPDIQVMLLNDDVAVVAYKVHEELLVDGKPVTLDAADASTWVRRDGQWRCALHTEAISGDPFGRDRARPGNLQSV